MRIVIFGLTVSSSWGNGHAALWRGLISALGADGHQVSFFERDQPFYAQARDLHEIRGGELVIYPDWRAILPRARQALAGADVAIVTSYCPDGVAATTLVMEAAVAVRCFYDMDTPVTLARLAGGEPLPYIGPQQLGGFDVVLSYTGGQALDELRTRLGARRVVPLYGWADTMHYQPGDAQPHYAAALSYIGTYAADRQKALEELFVEPARRRPARRFVIAGAQYPASFPWLSNIYFVRHLPPAEHRSFYASSRLTLNVTRSAMARMGFCPSGRLFEAAACATPVLSDWWVGLDSFFTPGDEILIAGTVEQAIAALDLPAERLRAIGRRARERVLEEHSARHRAQQMLAALHDPQLGAAQAA